MIPSAELASTIPALVAADTDYLAAPTAMHVHLVIEPFVPSRDLDLSSLTLATFTGGGPKNAGTGAQQVFHDPLTNMDCIRLLEPAGGWSWLCTVAPAETETVVGYVVTDTANAVMLGSGLLDNPVPISAVNDGLSIPQITLAFLNNSPDVELRISFCHEIWHL